MLQNVSLLNFCLVLSFAPIDLIFAILQFVFLFSLPKFLNSCHFPAKFGMCSYGIIFQRLHKPYKNRFPLLADYKKIEQKSS